MQSGPAWTALAGDRPRSAKSSRQLSIRPARSTSGSRAIDARRRSAALVWKLIPDSPNPLARNDDNRRRLGNTVELGSLICDHEVEVETKRRNGDVDRHGSRA